MVEWEQKLKDFPAYKKYETFNRKTITNEENNPCNDLYFDNEEAEKFCKQAVEILKELPRITDDKARNEECAYFQHWFSDTVRRKFSNKDRFFSNYDLSNYLFDVINTFNYDKYNKTPNKCYASRNAEYVKIEKDLHDYFINFDSISCKGLSKKTCQMYYNYVQEILPHYKDRRDRHLCCYLANGEVETKCKNYFKCDKRYDPKKLLKNLEKEMEIIDRYGQVDKSSWDELVAKYDAEQQSKYQYWYSYDPYTYDYYSPSQYSSINQS
ncbi:variable surface protein, partial [Plasmodium gonderi]